jgi:hypothetical protein
MDVLNFILFGVRIAQDIANVLDDKDKKAISEQITSIEKITLDNRLKYNNQTVDDKINRVALVINSIWELVKSRMDLSDYDLQQKIIEIDLLDGKLDNKISSKVMTCSICGAGISRKFKKCQICGKEYPEIGNQGII